MNQIYISRENLFYKHTYKSYREVRYLEIIDAKLPEKKLTIQMFCMAFTIFQVTSCCPHHCDHNHNNGVLLSQFQSACFYSFMSHVLIICVTVSSTSSSLKINPKGKCYSSVLPFNCKGSKITIFILIVRRFAL